MKQLVFACAALCIGLSITSALARGGMTHSMSTRGGEFGTSAATPGTNSSGTAVSSSGIGKAIKGPPLGINPAIDREDAQVQKMIEGSICRGC